MFLKKYLGVELVVEFDGFLPRIDEEVFFEGELGGVGGVGRKQLVELLAAGFDFDLHLKCNYD